MSMSVLVSVRVRVRVLKREPCDSSSEEVTSDDDDARRGVDRFDMLHADFFLSFISFFFFFPIPDTY